MVSEWMHTLYGAIRVERLSPPVASRILVYATTAIYSGLASASSRLPSMVGALNGLDDLPQPQSARRYDGSLTAIAAERVVLDSLLREALPTTRAAFTRLADSLTMARVAAGVGESVQSQSEDLGRRIGLAIVAWSRTDGFDATRGRLYAPPTGRGLWVNDSPANVYAAQNLSGATDFVALDNPANLLQAGSASDRGLILNRPKRAGLATLPPVNMSGASEPYWGQIRPFVLKSWDECSVPDPPPFSTDRASTFYRDAQTVHATRLTLAPDQRAAALYWADNAGESGTPPGHWIAIASQMVSQRRLSAEEAARLMVLTAAAQADAFIATWGYKYRQNLTRPRTYIRSIIDSTWEPLIPTPPFPEYPSGHAAQSAAAAAVMTALLGDTPFDDSTSLSIGHPVRRFRSFRAAAEEAGMSRVYGGIHFPFGNTGGRALGECVGAKVVERFQAAQTR
jgi:membrane-associated phospholipid phosphatase